MLKNRIEDTDPGEKASFLELTQTFVKEHKFVVFMALVLIAAIIVISVQSTVTPKYDAFIMYTGPTYAASQSIYGNVIDGASEILSNEENKVEVAFSTLVYVSPELADYYMQEGIEYNGAYNAESVQSFDYALAAGEYCIMIIDTTLYEDTKDLDVFVPLSEIGVSSDAAYDEYALKLKELGIYKLDGFCELNEDSVVVLRKKSFIQSLFANQKKTEARYNAQREYFIKLVEFN